MTDHGNLTARFLRVFTPEDNDAMMKGRKRMFATRSEAGRYAAHIRWANARGVDPMTVDQWRATNGEMPTTELTGMALVSSRVATAKEAVDAIAKNTAPGSIEAGDEPSTCRAIYAGWGWKMQSATEAEYERVSQLAAEGITKSGTQLESGGNYILDDQGKIIAAKHLMDAMEKVTEAGKAIEAEAIARATGKLPEDFEMRGLTSETEITLAKEALGKARIDFRNKDGLAAKLIGLQWWQQPRPGEARYQEWSDARQSIIDAYNAKKKALSQAQKNQKAFVDSASALSDARLEVLSEIRSMGGKWRALDTATRPIDSGSGNAKAETLAKTVKAVVAKYVPTALVDELNKLGNKLYITQTSGGGGFSKDYKAGVPLLAIPSPRHTGAMSSPGVAIHEVMHALEYASPTRVHPLVSAFKNTRSYDFDGLRGSTGEVPRMLVGHVTMSDATPFGQRISNGVDSVKPWVRGSVVSSSTVVIEDKYGDTYAGRVYQRENNHMSNEQLTTGVQGAFFGHEWPDRFGSLDSHHIGFSLGVLATA